MSPEQVVSEQLEAYNTKDLERLLQMYAEDAEQFALHGVLLARGREAMRERFAMRFQEPDLHAHLLSRIVSGNIVVDHERITRNFPEGKGTVEMLCIYEVVNGTIQKASFATGEKVVWS